MKSFTNWINTFLSEKGIDSEEILAVPGNSIFGENLIPVGVLVDAILSAPAIEQKGIKAMLVRIDYLNGNVRHYLTHLAKAIAL